MTPAVDAASVHAPIVHVPNSVRPTSHVIVTWSAKEDVPVLLCIAVDVFPYPGGVHDTMRDCGSDTDVAVRTHQNTPDTPAIDVPDDDDDPVIVVVPDDDAPVVKVHVDHGNHYGNDSKPDNNPNDVHNKHNGCDADCTGKPDKTPAPKKDKNTK